MSVRDDSCRAEAARGLFWRLKAKGHIMVGITSYQEFPGSIRNPYDDRHTTKQDQVIHEAIDAWLHCFRCSTALCAVFHAMWNFVNHIVRTLMHLLAKPLPVQKLSLASAVFISR